MKAYNIGLFIKKKREEQHIRQEDLCRGICDKSTLSRIERGKQEPSSGILGVLLQRLGINEDQLAVLLGPKDFEISDLQIDSYYAYHLMQDESSCHVVLKYAKDTLNLVLPY